MTQQQAFQQALAHIFMAAFVSCFDLYFVHHSFFLSPSPPPPPPFSLSYQSLFPSPPPPLLLSLFVCLSVCLSLSLSRISLSVSVSVSLSLSRISLSFLPPPPLSLSVCLTLSDSLSLSLLFLLKIEFCFYVASGGEEGQRWWFCVRFISELDIEYQCRRCACGPIIRVCRKQRWSTARCLKREHWAYFVV